MGMYNLLFGAIFVYVLILITVALVAVIIFFYLKRKSKKIKKAVQEKVYAYKDYKLKLVRNTLKVKKAIYWLLKVDFRKAIEDENKALGFEYIKPFDFTKLRENVNIGDVLGGIVIISEKKELLPNILNLFVVDSNKYNFDFENDYNELSILASELLNDFFFENLRTMV